MSNRSDYDERLLAETFCGDWAEGRAADFARVAAAHARARRRARRAFAALGVAALAALLTFSTSRRVAPAPASAHELAVTVPPHRPEATQTPTLSAGGYEVISDEELLAHLREQPVFVLKKHDGSREIVLLANE